MKAKSWIKEINSNKFIEIKNKIRDKDIALPTIVNTSNDVKILIAIKDQLKVENDTLSNWDLENITDSIISLTSRTQIPITLTIIVGSQFDTIDITILRPKNIVELNTEVVETIKNKITNKNIALLAKVDTSWWYKNFRSY